MAKKQHSQTRTALPEDFLLRFEQIAGALYPSLQNSFVERPTTFRVNRVKVNEADALVLLRELRDNNFRIQKILWYRDAYILENKTKRELTDTQIYKDGKIYIQSLASMAPPLIMRPLPGMRVLDLTAAPGSKTSQIASIMNCEGELVANENNKVRFFKLKHNLELLGVFGQSPLPDPPLVKGGSDQFLGVGGGKWRCTLRLEDGRNLSREYNESFDQILVDAPCSAEARFLNHEPETWGYWKERKIKEMAYAQWGLLLSAWQMLKPGGVMVYSTCTFAPEENELQISKFLERVGKKATLEKAEIEGLKKMPLVKTWKTKTVSLEVQKNCLRILPTKDIEGFFVAKIRKIN